MAKFKKKKLPVGITEEFINEVSTMDVQQKKNMIARLEGSKQDAKDFVKNHPEVVSVRDTLKEMTASATETIKAVRNRQTYLVNELKELGEFAAATAQG
jgi:hypothetical protein